MPNSYSNPYAHLGLGGAIDPTTGVMAAGNAPQPNVGFGQGYGGATAQSGGTGNPYLSAEAGAITNQVNQNLMQTQLPAINRGAVLNGGYGGSRQGIAQSGAIGATNQGLSNSLAGLYGNAYNQDQNRAQQMAIAGMQDQTQRLGLQNQYALGQGNLGLGQQSLDNNFYSTQRGQDLQAQNQGWQQSWGNDFNNLALGQAQTNIGNQQQQASFSPLQNWSSIVSPYTGLNQSNTNTQPSSGGGVAGAAGGALTMAQIWALLNKGG